MTCWFALETSASAPALEKLYPISERLGRWQKSQRDQASWTAVAFGSNNCLLLFSWQAPWSYFSRLPSLNKASLDNVFFSFLLSWGLVRTVTLTRIPCWPDCRSRCCPEQARSVSRPLADVLSRWRLPNYWCRRHVLFKGGLISNATSNCRYQLIFVVLYIVTSASPSSPLSSSLPHLKIGAREICIGVFVEPPDSLRNAVLWKEDNNVKTRHSSSGVNFSFSVILLFVHPSHLKCDQIEGTHAFNITPRFLFSCEMQCFSAYFIFNWIYGLYKRMWYRKRSL